MHKPHLHRQNQHVHTNYPAKSLYIHYIIGKNAIDNQNHYKNWVIIKLIVNNRDNQKTKLEMQECPF